MIVGVGIDFNRVLDHVQMAVRTFSPRRWIISYTIILLLLAAGVPASAQVSCGDVPKDVPEYTQEQLKADVEGHARVIPKLLGGMTAVGSVEASRSELYEQHQNVDQHQIDMYFSWVACQAIMADATLATSEKVVLWTKVRAAFGSSATVSTGTNRNPNALYQLGEAVANVEGAVISAANGTVTFQTVRTGTFADPTREVEYQDWVLTCPDLPKPLPNRIVANFSGVIIGATCHIVRKAATP